MKILITNDDGWDAPGLATLRAVAQQFGNVWSVAPLHPMSGISHQITFERPLSMALTDHQAYSLDGTPADCVRIALTQLPVAFDWVLSGINNGGNLGSDVYVSGTVAAAREASLLGIPAVALSQHRCRFKLPYDWTRTGWMAEQVLGRLLQERAAWQTLTLHNVNFPDKFHSRENDSLAPDKAGLSSDWESSDWESSDWEIDKASFLSGVSVVECAGDRRAIPTDYRLDEQGRYLYCGKYHERDRSPDCDIENCFSGAITISRLSI